MSNHPELKAGMLIETTWGKRFVIVPDINGILMAYGTNTHTFCKINPDWDFNRSNPERIIKVGWPRNYYSQSATEFDKDLPYWEESQQIELTLQDIAEKYGVPEVLFFGIKDMIRVNKGEEYYYLCFGENGGSILWDKRVEKENSIDNCHFYNHNYFCTKEEAESMINKLNAVLKGADVIERL